MERKTAKGGVLELRKLGSRYIKAVHPSSCSDRVMNFALECIFTVDWVTESILDP